MTSGDWEIAVDIFRLFCIVHGLIFFIHFRFCDSRGNAKFEVQTNSSAYQGI